MSDAPLPWTRLRRLIDAVVEAEIENALSGGHEAELVRQRRAALEDAIVAKEYRMRELADERFKPAPARRTRV